MSYPTHCRVCGEGAPLEVIYAGPPGGRERRRLLARGEQPAPEAGERIVEIRCPVPQCRLLYSTQDRA